MAAAVAIILLTFFYFHGFLFQFAYNKIEKWMAWTVNTEQMIAL